MNGLEGIDPDPQSIITVIDGHPSTGTFRKLRASFSAGMLYVLGGKVWQTSFSFSGIFSGDDFIWTIPLGLTEYVFVYPQSPALDVMVYVLGAEFTASTNEIGSEYLTEHAEGDFALETDMTLIEQIDLEPSLKHETV